MQLSHESFIDGYIDQTHVMIEQKGSNKDLDKPIKQSDGGGADALSTGTKVC